MAKLVRPSRVQRVFRQAFIDDYNRLIININGVASKMQRKFILEIPNIQMVDQLKRIICSVNRLPRPSPWSPPDRARVPAYVTDCALPGMRHGQSAVTKGVSTYQSLCSACHKAREAPQWLSGHSSIGGWL